MGTNDEHSPSRSRFRAPGKGDMDGRPNGHDHLGTLALPAKKESSAGASCQSNRMYVCMPSQPAIYLTVRRPDLTKAIIRIRIIFA